MFIKVEHFIQLILVIINKDNLSALFIFSPFMNFTAHIHDLALDLILVFSPLKPKRSDSLWPNLVEYFHYWFWFAR